MIDLNICGRTGFIIFLILSFSLHPFHYCEVFTLFVPWMATVGLNLLRRLGFRSGLWPFISDLPF